MGKIDTETKLYMSDNARFADAFNFLIFDGEQVITPESLTPLDTAEIVIPYRNDSKIPVQKFRDILKGWQLKTDGEAFYSLIGMELESEVNYTMPVKAALYDCMHYAKQVESARNAHRKQKTPLSHGEFLSEFRKEDHLIPLITLVIFLKDTEWDAPTHLWEMFESIAPALLPFVSDYKINLLAPCRLEHTDFQKFRTDVGLLLEYIKNQKDKDKLDEIVHEGDRFRHLDYETASLINTITGSRLKFDIKEDKVDMCQAIEEMRKESREEGREEGRAEGVEFTTLESIRKVMKRLKYTAQQAMDLLEIPPADWSKYMAKL